MSRSDFTCVMCYDIHENKVRRQVAALLEDKLCRVQMSVFEGRITQKVANSLFDQVSALLLPGDSLRMYSLSKTGLENSRVSGGAPLPENEDFWLL